jgi:hypothetical protein
VARHLPTTSYCSSSSYRPILDRCLCPVTKLLRALKFEGQVLTSHVEWATQVADTVGSDIGHRLPARIPTHLALTVDCSSITKADGLSSQLGPYERRSLILTSWSIREAKGGPRHLITRRDRYRETSWSIAFGALIQQHRNPHKLSQKEYQTNQHLCMIRFSLTFSCQWSCGTSSLFKL